jgi:isopentenyldiphosphate isomerase
LALATGAVLLTADSRVQDVPYTAGNWNKAFEFELVPVLEQRAEAALDINADMIPVVD